jgi:hypothetical protein
MKSLPMKLNLVAVRLLVALFFLTSGFLYGAPSASTTPTLTEWVDVSMTIDANGRSAQLAIPDSATRLVVERKNRKGKWSAWHSKKLKSGTTTQSVRLPKSSASDWRAKVEVPLLASSTNRKYPSTFYKGARAFTAAAANGYVDSSSASVRGGMNGRIVALSSVALSDSSKSTESATPVEADIWKTDGNTVYFFNQLRGLQIIDMADPANPALISSLRLPAVGQDLYVLPAQGNNLHAVLLTRDTEDWSSSVIQLVRITGGKPAIIATRKVKGWLSDSRMAGANLYLATQNWTSANGSWTEQAILTQVSIDTSTGSLTSPSEYKITGRWPVISAGVGWMAVATSQSTNWNKSDVTLFSFNENGLTQLNATPIETAGRIYDKFKMQVKDGVFTAISQGWQSSDGQWTWWNGTQVTQLENFNTNGDALGSLEIIRGENLYATRFAGDKTYAVTFRQTDPLWVIDLSDSAHPTITGHLEVPGWSTYIEPLGDLLFAIGVDSGRVEASLFDVADPANPKLASRIQLSESWGYSEALYNEKALKILPDENLALIPFSSYGQSDGTAHSIQLVEWDTTAKTLRKRGAIVHEFEPRRSAIVSGVLASISQRQLITADITNRDNPTVLADLLLAWPVNRLALKDDFLLEIADGSTWWDSQSAIRVASTQDPDSILEETTIPTGRVTDAVVRGDRLFVSREIGMQRYFGYFIRPLGGSSSNDDAAPTLAVDVYDVSKLPALTLLSTTQAVLPANETSWDTSRLLFPSDNSVVLITQPRPNFRWYWGEIEIVPLASNTLEKIASNVIPWRDGWYKPEFTQPAQALVFDFQNPATPTVSTPIAITEKEVVNIKDTYAASGLVVFGFGHESGKDISENLQSYNHRLGILDVQNITSPVLRPSIDLPGRLTSASDITSDGFLAWTDAWNETTQSMELQVSACDLTDVYEVTSITRPEAFAILNREIFIGTSSSIERHRLGDAGLLQKIDEAPLDWAPSSISISNGTNLLGGDASHVLSIPLSTFPASPVEWETDRYLDLDSIVSIPNGDILAPAGENGVDRFTP